MRMMRILRVVVLLLIALGGHSSIALAEEQNEKPKISAETAIEKFEQKKVIIPNELIVKFKENVSNEEKQKVLNSLKTDELSFIEQGNFSLIKAPKGTNLQSLAEKLLQLSQIEFVEPNYIIENTFAPKDPGYSKQWHLKKIQASKAWDITKGSSQITVAVVDGGVQTNHPDLAGKIVSPYNAVTGGRYVPSDEHGTHVAGIIAASINKKGVVGVAPNVKIMPVNVFDGDSASAFDVANGIMYAADHNANIINLSLGTYHYSWILDYAVQYAASKGVIVIAAAGNDDTSQEVYPAALDNVIGVSATDRNDRITDFSNFGYYVDFSAPGKDIYSIFPKNSYQSLNGTSMATPIVSGVAALILSKNPLLTPAEVENILKKSAFDLYSKGWDYFYGYGRVDAYNALKNTPSPLSDISAASMFTMKGNNKSRISFTVHKGSKVTVYIKDAKGKVVKYLIKDKKWNSRNVSVSWDGKQDNGAFVGDGTYIIVVKLSNEKESVSKSKSIKVVDKVIPSIQLSTANVSFSPKAKGRVAIPFVINKKAKVTAKIYDSRGNVVRTIWSNKGFSGGKYALTWDGKNNKGKLLNDGTYKLTMSVTDYKNRKGTTRKKSIIIDTKVIFGSVLLDNTVFKMNGFTKSHVKFQVKEPVTISVYVKTEKGINVKQPLSNKKYNVGSYTISWDGRNNNNAFVNEGKYYYMFEVKDNDGNKTIVKSKLFTLQDWRKPSIQASANLYYRQTGNMDISYTTSKQGKVAIEIYQGSTLIKSLLKDSPQTAGSKKVTWDGKDQSGAYVADGTYQVKMTIVDNYQQSSSFTSNLQVALAKVDIEYPSIVHFYEGMGSKVYFKLSAPAKVTVQIFDEYDEKIRTIFSNQPMAGIQSFTWDGRDDDGYDVYYDSYSYFFKITATYSNGNQTVVKGEINNEKDPSWLTSHTYSLIPDDVYNYYYKTIQLNIVTTKPVTATLYVYEESYYDDEPIDFKVYNLKVNENIIIYTKPSIFEYYYYLLEYKDNLGNKYYYEIDEYSDGYLSRAKEIHKRK
jgi:flagellar hook assembly protein FlgD